MKRFLQALTAVRRLIWIARSLGIDPALLMEWLIKVFGDFF